jgi:deoxyribodipyrimidine photo-lyase
MYEIDIRRVSLAKTARSLDGPVVYWMSRDQRVNDNWALLYAQTLAAQQQTPVAVVFCLVPKFLGATFRQYNFMIEGLKSVEEKLIKLNIPFLLLQGLPHRVLPDFLKKSRTGALVTDFSPLRIKQNWNRQVAHKVNIPFFEVDAHNVVPVWVASDKQEFAAYTFRPKIKKLLPEFLSPFPKLKKQTARWPGAIKTVDWNKAYQSLNVDQSVPAVNWLRPGEKYAAKILRQFIKQRLEKYNRERNDPNRDVQSNLSPYLHFGQISAQRVALEIMSIDNIEDTKESFLEELIVRRELADNFCHYNSDYDAVSGFPEWAGRTLDDHRGDPREYLYSKRQFENASTHDDLWNAAQSEMVHTGKMHGYMRMYWAKKILEWSATPEKALETAIYLNDKYELDGRDPNGYAGIAWSIGGVHDRPWPERDIFGKIRFMSYDGCRRKFDVKKYIQYANDLIDKV